MLPLLTCYSLGRFLKKLVGKSDIENALRRFEKLLEEESRMVAVQGLVEMCGVREEMMGLGSDVRDIEGRVNVANNKLNVVLHGVHLVFIWSHPLNLIIGFLVCNLGSNVLTGNQQRQDVVDWISPPDLSVNFKIANDVHHPGTGEWFTQGSIFRSWKESGSLLWIHGKRTLFNPCALLLANRAPCSQRVLEKLFLGTSFINLIWTG